MIQLIITSNIVSISWNSSWDKYLIEEYSRNYVLIRNWTTSNRINTQHNLSNVTEKVKISICLISNLKFTLGKTCNL